jgi:hypothetical protein
MYKQVFIYSMEYSLKKSDIPNNWEIEQNNEYIFKNDFLKTKKILKKIKKIIDDEFEENFDDYYHKVHN